MPSPHSVCGTKLRNRKGLQVKEIIVSHGDTLWGLAGKYLGNPERWPEIYRHNVIGIYAEQRRYDPRGHKMNGPDWIFAGMKLNIPCCH